jgi:glutaredoxin
MIEIYSKENCGHCVSALSLANQKCLEYKEIKIGYDIDRDVFVKQYPSIRQVPAIFIDGEYIGGLNEFKQRMEVEC